MKVTLPWPPVALGPNARRNRLAISGIRAKYREDCYYSAHQQTGGVWTFLGRVPVRIIFHPPDRRHRDMDNMLASAKTAIDGFALAVRCNDRTFRPLTLDDGPPVPGGAIVLEWNEP